MRTDPALVLDLGGGSIKIGFSNQKEPLVADNAIYRAKNVSGKTFFGADIQDCNNLSSLFFSLPFKKGYINSWEFQKQILDSVFKRVNGSESLQGVDLICTEPYFNFMATKETMNEMFFEDYGVNSLVRTNPAFLAAYKYRLESSKRSSRYSLVIDSGYSFTHLLPNCDGQLMRDFILRLPVGGKILTNRLMEMISYRQLDVRSELYIMNQCKEAGSFVSTKFFEDMATARKRGKDNPLLREYVLPDYVNHHHGFLREPEFTKTTQGYVLTLNNERFAVPELLFNPGDVGFTEMGLSEALPYLLNEKLPRAVRPGILANVVLIGGNAGIPGFSDRVKQELRASAPEDLQVNVFKPENPQTYAWQGGVLLHSRPDDFRKYVVTKKDFAEYGNALCEERFPVT